MTDKSELRVCPQCGLCVFQDIVNEEKKIYKCNDCGCVYAIIRRGTLTPGEFLSNRLKKIEGKEQN